MKCLCCKHQAVLGSDYCGVHEDIDDSKQSRLEDEEVERLERAYAARWGEER